MFTPPERMETACRYDVILLRVCDASLHGIRHHLQRYLQPTCDKLSLPRITWHGSRHCHATLLDAVGAPLGTVQALLGHASPEVTRQIYLHAIPAEQRRAVEEVEKPLVEPKWTQVGEIAGRPN